MLETSNLFSDVFINTAEFYLQIKIYCLKNCPGDKYLVSQKRLEINILSTLLLRRTHPGTAIGFHCRPFHITFSCFVCHPSRSEVLHEDATANKGFMVNTTVCDNCILIGLAHVFSSFFRKCTEDVQRT